MPLIVTKSQPLKRKIPSWNADAVAGVEVPPVYDVINGLAKAVDAF